MVLVIFAEVPNRVNFAAEAGSYEAATNKPP
jgi:hypothetical protein